MILTGDLMAKRRRVDGRHKAGHDVRRRSINRYRYRSPESRSYRDKRWFGCHDQARRVLALAYHIPEIDPAIYAAPLPLAVMG